MWLLQQQNVKRDTIEKKITATTDANAVNVNAHAVNANAKDDNNGTDSITSPDGAGHS